MHDNQLKFSFVDQEVEISYQKDISIILNASFEMGVLNVNMDMQFHQKLQLTGAVETVLERSS